MKTKSKNAGVSIEEDPPPNLIELNNRQDRSKGILPFFCAKFYNGF